MEVGIYHVSVSIFWRLGNSCTWHYNKQVVERFFSTLKILSVTVSWDKSPPVIAQNISPFFLNLCQVQAGASMTWDIFQIQELINRTSSCIQILKKGNNENFFFKTQKQLLGTMEKEISHQFNSSWHYLFSHSCYKGGHCTKVVEQPLLNNLWPSITKSGKRLCPMQVL